MVKRKVLSVDPSTMRPRYRMHRPWKYLRQLLNCNKDEAKHLWDAMNAAIVMQLIEQGHLTIDGLCRIELNRRADGRINLRTKSYKYLTNLAEDKDDVANLKDILADYQIDILKAKYNGTLGAATWLGFTDQIDEEIVVTEDESND